tara:strand:- start:525 stop:1331 length:807 start_codon:yes stop_codon:yes gene_type:complete
MTGKFLVMFCRMFFFYCIIILISCSAREDGSSVVLARVGDAVLTTKDLPVLSSKDALSKDVVSAFIEEWVNDAVLYRTAKKRGLLTDERLKRSRDAYYKKIVVSAFIDSETSANINISTEDVRLYYKAHRDEFYRGSDEVYAHHFIAQKISDAKNIRDQLTRVSKKEPTSLDGFLIESRYIKRGRLINKLDRAIFSTKKAVVGPIKTRRGFHVFDVVHRYLKGSTIGLDASYDEIYQRLVKQRSTVLSLQLLDSLKKDVNIFINSNYH